MSLIYQKSREQDQECFFECFVNMNSEDYFMLSGRISRIIGENIFRSYTGSTSENTDFHAPVIISR